MSLKNAQKCGALLFGKSYFVHEACPLLGFRRLSVIQESLQLLEEIALDCWLCAVLLLMLSCIIFAKISIKDLWK